MDLLEALKGELRPEEGLVLRATPDPIGILSIGYGFNLTRPDADDLLVKLGLAPTAVRSGKWAITFQQAEWLLAYCAEGALEQARDAVGEDAWERLPDEAKVVFGYMVYNMGRYRFDGFHKMIAAAREVPPDFAEIERQMDDSQWDRQLPGRADHLEAIIDALIPKMTAEDRARFAGLFIPARPGAGAHAGDDPAEQGDA